jgi:hypothetical protein
VSFGRQARAAVPEANRPAVATAINVDIRTEDI